MNIRESFYRTRTAWRAFWALHRLKPEQVQNYLDAFEIFRHDWKDQPYDERVSKSIVDYYTVINHLCALGQVEKMYIPPAIDLSKNVVTNQNLFEERMARDLGMSYGDRALELGCGRGRVAAHLATYSGAKINGINIDEGQLRSARRFALRHGLHGQCRFQVGDINNIPLPFAANAFEQVYQIQVFSYAKNMPALFEEIYRVLKPGGRVACLDYVLKSGYDETNPHHVDLVQRTKPLLGAVGSPRVDEYIAAIVNAGFEVKVSEDASIDGHQSALITRTSDHFGKVEKWMNRLVRWRVLPKHFPVLFKPLSGGDAFVEADQLQILTTSWYIVAQKPLAK